ncbi:UbiD family decarboxylase [Prauserella muralis]|uniref:3-octaprenyl-4-hydroxybenzoate carboxy-lyase n=1 Tax=Prauserella muralis TaxID=588067 RepID=A0A2V4AFS4_9PSEU|nr:UbiD family decarboxylase [Prauserella muralis]PXY18795.1 3-octaprenyl-4-hydroxybenzoate carboxy-lyase [Prauserella muralis]TWE28643.1 2,5-furandicarboxylate decarboxylase 1 [Prauserella muralis]
MTATELPPGADLRTWLDHLAATGRLALTDQGIDLRFGVAGVANRLDGRQATLFPRPSGHPVPIVSGLLSQRTWMAEAAGVAEQELVAHFQQACREPLPSKPVGTAPCQEVVHRDFALTELLPLPTHNEHDHGAYITAGLLITREHGSGRQNVSIHRLQVSGPDRLGALLLPRHTLAFFRDRERAGADLDVAIVVGADPLTLMASQAIVPLGQDELEIAGALRGEPLPVVRCLDSDIHVPANAEIVLEGTLLAGVREPEGPFGEFPQYYGARAERHVIQLSTVTHRRDPLYHTIVGGGREHLLLGCLPREASFLSELRRNFPCVTAVHLSLGGTCRYHLYVQVDRPAPGEAKNVILAALAVHYDVKHVTAVDTDVDVDNAVEVEWAVATRFQADRDLVVVPGTQGSKLDPSTDGGVGAKLGFDATVPPGTEPMRFTRIGVPGQDQLDIGSLTRDAGADWHAAIR